MTRANIRTSCAPAPVGPYSQAVVQDSIIFCSGQLGIDPSTGELAGDEVGAQTERAIMNLREVLAAAGADLSSVVRTTVYLCDIRDFQRVNEIYGRFFDSSKPARTTVGVSALPKGAKVEIDAIAMRDI